VIQMLEITQGLCQILQMHVTWKKILSGF
jgi:hypothetical protein